MDENNFEKKMQEQMVELKIQPSASVWDRVESRIRKNEPRKRFAWLFLALLLGSLAGGYYFLNYDPITTGDGYTQNEKVTTTILDKDKQDSPDVMISNAESISDEKIPEPSDSFVPLIAGNSRSSTPKMNKTQVKEKHTQEINLKMADDKEVAFATPGVEIQTKESKDEISFIGEKENTVVDSTQTVLPAYTPDAIAMIKDEKEDEEFIQMKTANADSANAEAVPKPSGLPKHKWVIGFTFSAAKSLVSEGILGIKAQEDMYYNNPGNSSGTPPGTGNPFQRTHTINPEYNTAFNAGIFAQKKLSAQHIIALGLNYKYFSTTNIVSYRISSSAYNAVGNIYESYNSHFHLLEIPVDLKIETRQHKKIPVTYRAGASVSHMISTNALHYENQRFFTDNSLFNKTQLSLNGGISVVLFSRNKFPVSIGPFFNYGLNPLADKNLYGGKYLHSFGVRTEILLNKK